MSEPEERDTTCPTCEAKHDLVSGMTDEDTPDPGSLSLCIRCGVWAIFDEDLSLRKPTNEEAIEISADPYVQQCHAAWLATVGGGDSEQ